MEQKALRCQRIEVWSFAHSVVVDSHLKTHVISYNAEVRLHEMYVPSERLPMKDQNAQNCKVGETTYDSITHTERTQ